MWNREALTPAGVPSGKNFFDALHVTLARIDPRLVFLERAAAKLALIEACAVGLDEAFDGLTPAIYQFAGCCCYREILEKFDEAARDSNRRDHRHGHDQDRATDLGRAVNHGWLRGLARTVVNAPEGERNATLFWAACRGGEAVRDDKADEDFVADVLIEAAMRAGLSEREACNTVKSGMYRDIGALALTQSKQSKTQVCSTQRAMGGGGFVACLFFLGSGHDRSSTKPLRSKPRSS